MITFTTVKFIAFCVLMIALGFCVGQITDVIHTDEFNHLLAIANAQERYIEKLEKQEEESYEKV